MINYLKDDGRCIMSIDKTLLQMGEENSSIAYAIAEMHYNGIDTKKNTDEAIKWYKKAADFNNEDSLLKLYAIYSTGIEGNKANNYQAMYYLIILLLNNYDEDFIKKSLEIDDFNLGSEKKLKISDYMNELAVKFKVIRDEKINKKTLNKSIINKINKDKIETYSETELKEFEILANQGNNEMKILLGRIYIDGLGVNKDIYTGMYWFIKGIENNDSECMIRLANMYLTGIDGIEKNEKKAIELYKQAEESEDNKSFGKIASLYHDGDLFPLDFDKAMHYYEKAFENGDSISGMHIAKMYKNGEGCLKDDAKMVKWAEKSAYDGFAPAYEFLGSYYLEINENNKAEDWYKDGVILDDIESINKLAYSYINGGFTEINPIRSLALYIKALRLDIPNAKEALKTYFNLDL